MPLDNGAASGAFVAGATGYVGRHVVDVLRARGIATVAHVRPDAPRRDEWVRRFAQSGAEVSLATWDPGEMHTTLGNASPRLVFALLGTTSKRAAREGSTAAREYERVDYGLSALLLDAAAATAGVERFVYLSSAGVRPGTRNPYLLARFRMEERLRRSEVPWLIARPSFITGPDREEDRPMERVAARAADLLLTVPGMLGAARLRDRWRSITGRELAVALVRLALDPAAANTVVTGEDLRG
jgi:nucleoside-diphosphate-sugar epimerase